MAQLRRGDSIVFLSEGDHDSLLRLLWRFGAPAVLLLAAFVALALWRAGARFGPPIAATVTARRSLAEQIRGTGQFALRFGGGRALHAAALRALRDAAVQRFPNYDQMASETRVAALAKASGIERRRARAGHELFRGAQLARAVRRHRGARIRTPPSIDEARSEHGN